MPEEMILGRLQSIFRDVFDDPALTIGPDTTAQDIAEWDSLNNITIVVSVEKEFNVRFNLGDIRALRNIGDMVELVARKLADAK